MYSITKGQIITFWIFGVLYWLNASFEGEAPTMFFLVPFILIFYTLGWRAKRK